MQSCILTGKTLYKISQVSLYKSIHIRNLFELNNLRYLNKSYPNLKWIRLMFHHTSDGDFIIDTFDRPFKIELYFVNVRNDIQYKICSAFGKVDKIYIKSQLSQLSIESLNFTDWLELYVIIADRNDLAKLSLITPNCRKIHIFTMIDFNIP